MNLDIQKNFSNNSKLFLYKPNNRVCPMRLAIPNEMTSKMPRKSDQNWYSHYQDSGPLPRIRNQEDNRSCDKNKPKLMVKVNRSTFDQSFV